MDEGSVDFLKPIAIVLVSPLTPEECRLRILAELEKPIDYHVKSVVGKVTGLRMQLRVRDGWGHGGGSFQTLLDTAMSGEGQGTRIEGTLGVHPFTRILVVVMLAFLPFGAFAVAFGDGGGEPTWPSISAPLFMAAVVYGGLRAARDEGPFLLEFVLRVLVAKETSR